MVVAGFFITTSQPLNQEKCRSAGIKENEK